MSRKLDDLKPMFRLRTFELLARLTEHRIPIVITDTLRTQAEHEINLARHVSWIQHSLHLDGLAIDICPLAMYQLRGPNKLEWDSSDPVWQEIGAIGESIGLKWGGRWPVKDMGHFEYAESMKA